jgi:hypothetical protein
MLEAEIRFVHMAAEGYGRLLSSPYGGITGGWMASGQTSSNPIGNPPRPSMVLAIPSEVGPIERSVPSVLMLPGSRPRDPKLVLIDVGLV